MLVTEPEHPFMRLLVAPGHIVGWGDTFTHEIAHLLAAIAGEGTIAPHGATFEDGYRCSEVTDAILRSSAAGAERRSPTGRATHEDVSRHLGARPDDHAFHPGGATSPR